MTQPDPETAKNAINAAIDLFHRRWLLRIIWELRSAALTFRELQQACSEISPSVLNQRLGELRRAGIVEHAAGEGYLLSGHGRELLRAMRPMMKWSLAWYEAHGRASVRGDARAKAQGAAARRASKTSRG